jgi:hypothetical protein
VRRATPLGEVRMQRAMLKKDVEFKVLGQKHKVMGKVGQIVAIERHQTQPGVFIIWWHLDYKRTRRDAKYATIPGIELPDTVDL